MTRIWVLILPALLAAASILLSRPVRIVRDPRKEGCQDEEASRAYDRTSRWPIFAFERYVIMRSLREYLLRGVVMDIGCGPGFLAARVERRFPKTTVVGLDINPFMLNLASANRSRSNARYALIRGDASELPLAGNTVNLVVSSLSLHHWEDPSAAIREILRVLAPGGRLLIFDARRDVSRLVFWTFIVGQALFGPSAIRRTNGAVGSLWSSYTRAELEGLLGAEPFADVQVFSRPGWLLAKATKSASTAVR